MCFNPGAQLVVLAMPTLTLAILILRMCVSAAAEDSLHAKTELARLIGEMLRNYRLIVDFYQRPKINDMVAAKVSGLQMAEVPEAITGKGIEYFAVWLGALCVGAIAVMQAPDLLGEERWLGNSLLASTPVSLGAFLATIQAVRDLNRALSSLQALCFTLMGTMAPVRDFTFLFNLETDLAVWRQVDHFRRELSLELGTIARRNSLNDFELGVRGPKYAVDGMQMIIKDVAFHYGSSEPVIMDTTLCVQQGKLVALRGHHSSGKRTFLHLLGHSIFPVNGTVFVPGHLRILQVSDHTMLFETWSAWDNLVFGTPRVDLDKRRVRGILEALDMRRTLGLVEDELSAHNEDVLGFTRNRTSTCAPTELPVDARAWHEGLSSTERSKMCLARALIANPEVLILHKPFLKYESQTKPLVRSALMEHKLSRGIALDQASIDQRRPRTCFYSVVDPRDADMADVVWEIDATTKTVSEVRSWPLGVAADVLMPRKSSSNLAPL
uniref:ABC transporter domain-containing protein n=1 Tax=Alexandrium catenella TaxID=2925 RepID=A0A7S1QLM0_ALECA